MSSSNWKFCRFKFKTQVLKTLSLNTSYIIVTNFLLCQSAEVPAQWQKKYNILNDNNGGCVHISHSNEKPRPKAYYMHNSTVAAACNTIAPFVVISLCWQGELIIHLNPSFVAVIYTHLRVDNALSQPKY
jgi:hypothetical protein